MKKYFENWRKYILKENKDVDISEETEEIEEILDLEEGRPQEEVKVGDRVRTSDGMEGRLVRISAKAKGPLADKYQVSLDSGQVITAIRVTKV